MEKKIFVVLIAGILFAVFGFSILHKGNSKELSGVYTKYDKPEFSLEGYQSGEYQTQMDNYYSANYSAHNLAVRIYNQVRYTAFGISDSVVVGRDGYLYEKSYIRETMGVDGAILLSDEELKSLAGQILAIQELAEEQGKGFLFVITPSKADYEQGNIPKNYMYMDASYSQVDRNYIRLKAAFDELGVHYIDSNEFLSEEGLGAPVFYETGIHWTRVAAIDTMNEMTGWLNEQYGYRIPQVKVEDIIASETTEDDQDQDLYRLLNVYYAKKDALYYTPVESIETQDESDKPAIFVQGGSFTNKLMQIAADNQMFSEAMQEFYAEWLQDYNRGTGVGTGDLSCPELGDAINQADIIILETNVENVTGLMPEMYDSIYQHLSEHK